MYKIRIDPSSLSSISATYLAKYKEGLRDEINEFLRGHTFLKTVGSKDKMTLTIQVKSGSFTHSFLSRCVNPKDKLLDDLLIGGIDEQLSIIRYVVCNGSDYFKKLTASKAKRNGYVSGDVIDDFNAIMHEIFVTRSFEGKGPIHARPLDKNAFVKDLDIRICPYCGRAYIYRVEKIGKDRTVAVKPQLDHFLPKAYYPFLGMNFFNLIPCCSVCNLAPLKVDKDPLDSTKSKVSFLMQPHQFDEKKIKFIYKQVLPDTYNPESYDILVGYTNKELKKGYNKFLAIDKFYSKHNVELRNMILRCRAFRAATNGLYKDIGINDTHVPSYAAAILGFNLSPVEEGKQLMYKFKKDTFLQMLGSPFDSSSQYYVDLNGREKIVTI